MDDNAKVMAQSSRREFLALAAGAVAAPLPGNLIESAFAQTAQTPPAPNVQAGGAARSKPNILFVFTDQERYSPKWPSGLSLPGHERLLKE